MGIIIPWCVIFLVISILMFLTGVFSGSFPMLLEGLIFSLILGCIIFSYFRKLNKDEDFKKREMNSLKMWNNMYIKIVMENGDEAVYKFDITEKSGLKRLKKFREEAEDRMRLWTPENERVKSLKNITWIEYSEFNNNKES